MATLDAGLRFLQAQSGTVLDEIAEGAREMVARPQGRRARRGERPTRETRVRVLAQFTGERSALERAGLEVTSMIGDVVAGFVNLSALEAVAAVPGLDVIEQSRPMRGELDLSMPATRANLVHTGPPGRRGAGVIVGVIDSGIDWRHHAFRRADGSSRILRIWDQRLTPVAGESSPAGFTFGVEYTKAHIDANLAGGTPPVPVRHADAGGHGSHVAGIAAGDGSVAGNGRPAFTFVGMAPEADIVVVANTIGAGGLGDSANTLDAAGYIFGVAASLTRPAVINLSQGDYIGPHDGTSLLERGIDTLLGTAGRAMVKSAGNAAQDEAHATGVVPAGGVLELPMAVSAGDTSDDTVDIWYEGPDRFGFSVVPPGGAASAVVNPPATTTINLPSGNRVFVDSTLNNPFNADNRIFLRIQRGTAGAIQTGTWRLRLHGQVVTNGRAHAWIQRNHGPVFLAPTVSAQSTISIPGTGRRIITVGSFVTRGAGVGSLSSFSSRGPTRDNRTKPEISAPGQAIISVLNGASGTNQYTSMSGTSMAAPHVAGAVALMLQRRPTATIAQIRACLTSTAVKDAFTGATTNNDWGFGKLDAKAANDCSGATSPLADITVKALDDFTLKTADDPTLKAADDPTLKTVDDPTLKTADDPTLKAADDPTLKTVDDPTLKTADDPTLKAADDPTLKTADDPTVKAADDPTLKLADDVTVKAADDVTIKAADDGTVKAIDDGIAGGQRAGAGETAPFILSTPHHTNVWAESFPQAYAQTVSRLDAALAQVEQAIAALEAETDTESTALDQLERLYGERQRLYAEIAQMRGLA